MVKMSVLQFLFLLIALVAITGWLALKFFLFTCAYNASALKTILGYVWRRNPDILGHAMDMLGTEKVGVLPTDADFTDGNCRNCGRSFERNSTSLK